MPLADRGHELDQSIPELETTMEGRPYIKYPKPYRPCTAEENSGVPFINEPGQVCFGLTDFRRGDFRALHGHHTWEMIMVDSRSEGAGYVFFEGQWWRAEPGAVVFVPKGIVHSWSAGNTTGFRMIWIYGGAQAEAGRVWHEKPEEGRSISPEEERNATVWTSQG